MKKGCKSGRFSTIFAVESVKKVVINTFFVTDFLLYGHNIDFRYSAAQLNARRCQPCNFATIFPSSSRKDNAQQGCTNRISRMRFPSNQLRS